MADPARLKVIQSVAAALRGISIAGGYYYSVKAASVSTEPVNLLGVAGTELPFLIVAEDTRGVRVFHPARRTRETVALLITARVDAANVDGAERKIRAATQMTADIERALVVDITRGGVAFHTKVLAPDPMVTGVGPQNIVLVAQPVDVELLRVMGQS